ncbi:MAG TPA: rhodanese-like domain-containing protein [Kiritimatiellia bacterium]|nr:rhodanese-like domain-containing protein [Kiritimatiellia bacterium]HMP33295.1 rhodanese-like domain-containing protein [Kiritimatiellia bacterium]
MSKHLLFAGFVLMALVAVRGKIWAGDPTGVAWEAIREGALLIDTRTHGEFKAGHLDGAVNIPYEQTDALVALIGEDKGRAVVVYCRTGRRSGIALDALLARGYTNVVNGGGFTALREARANPARP